MNQSWIPLSDPDISLPEIEAVTGALQSAQLVGEPAVEAFEEAFAVYIGRGHGVAVASGGIGFLLILKAYGIGVGHEVIASPYSWRKAAHAIILAGAKPAFAAIDYWAGTLVPAKAGARITEKSPRNRGRQSEWTSAPWTELQELATQRGLTLIEDSTEAIGSGYKGSVVGSFGDCAIFGFHQPGPLPCGDSGMVVTDNAEIASMLRRLRGRRRDERKSVVTGREAPHQAVMSDVAAILGLAQLRRTDQILTRRKQTERWRFEYVKSFEGIKDAEHKVTRANHGRTDAERHLRRFDGRPRGPVSRAGRARPGGR